MADGPGKEFCNASDSNLPSADAQAKTACYTDDAHYTDDALYTALGDNYSPLSQVFVRI